MDPLLILGHQLSQTCNRILAPFPLSWSKSDQRWHKEKRKKVLLRYYLTQATLKDIILFPVILYMLLQIYKYFSIFSKAQILMQALLIPVLSASTFMDILLYFYATDIVQTINHIYSLQGIPWLSNTTGNIGLLIFALAIYFIATATLFPIFVVYANLDPMYVFAIALYGKKIAINSKYHRISIKLVRYVVFLLAVHLGMINLRTFTMLILNILLSARQLVRSLYNHGTYRISQKIRVYQELLLILSVIRPFAKRITGGTLFSLYIFIVGAASGTIYGLIYSSNISLSLSSAFLTSLSVFTIHVALQVSCSIFDLTSKLLSVWKHCTADRRDDGLLRKRLKAFPPLSIPAGGFGIIDEEMKTKYFDSMFNSVVDLLMTMDSLVQ